MKRYAILYIATLLVMVPLDFLFLGVLAKGFFQSQVGSVMGNLNITAAVLFYLMYAAAMVIFVNGGAGATWHTTLLYGAVLGFCCYATFDLTTLALLKGWTWPAAAMDMTWGTFATATASTLGFLIAGALAR